MADTEIITVNMSAVDLGKVDLLVQEGMYSNRTDFIRTAIRSQLEKHAVEVQQTISRPAYGIGFFSYDPVDLEKVNANGRTLKLTVVGLLTLASGGIPLLLHPRSLHRCRCAASFKPQTR